MRGLQGKVVIVAGAARGIGAALATRFASQRAQVAIVDMLHEPALALARELSSSEVRACAYRADITDALQVHATVAQIEAELGPIDILVNNAGRNAPGAFIESEPAHWQAMLDHNFLGPLNIQRAVLPSMSARRSGRIVSVASDAGRVGSANEAVYSGCKGAIIAFSKALAREVAKHGITVNVVCPGPTETQLFRDVAGEGQRAEQFRANLVRATPLGRLGQPDDVTGAVCFLSSDDAQFITGQVLSVSGGLTMVG
jgi:2-hydroxycyclohexanecarboxyl-CoA dehydrogenase